MAINNTVTTTVKKYEIIQKTGTNTYVKILPETSFDQVFDSTGKALDTVVGELNTAISTVANDLSGHINDELNPHAVTKAQVGLGNADNTSDMNKPVSNAQAIAISTAKSEAIADAMTGVANLKGVAGGYVPLNDQTLIEARYLPSYVDDVLEGYFLEREEATGGTDIEGNPDMVIKTYFVRTEGDFSSRYVIEAGKIYIDLKTNITYRWSGTQFTEISKSLAIGDVAGTAYAGDKGAKNAADVRALQTMTTNLNTDIAGIKTGSIKVGAIADTGVLEEGVEGAAFSCVHIKKDGRVYKGGQTIEVSRGDAPTSSLCIGGLWFKEKGSTGANDYTPPKHEESTIE